MSQAGLVEQIRRGHYRITDAGRELLANNPRTINNTTLRAYPSFIAFRMRSTSVHGPELANEGPTLVPQQSSDTPDQIISDAFGQIEELLSTDLLAAVVAMSPSQFEQLIVDLLLAMGYGGGDPDMGKRIGRSGDGGIDGIINEDALGLDAIYVQAKKYHEDNKIGRPALQAFVGSLTGEGATKGVFVTTSDFSREAKDYLNRVQHRIILINGSQLTRLMIQHEVGVRTRRSYLVKSIDEDYFSTQEA